MADDKAIKWSKSGQAKQAKVEDMTVRMEDTDGGVMVTIDGSTVSVEQLPDGTYRADTYQHRTFKDMDEMVRMLVRKVAELRRATE